MEKNTATTSSTPALPPGYIIHHAPNGTSFAVPQFFLPAAEIAIETEAMKNKIMADTTRDQVGFSNNSIG